MELRQVQEYVNALPDKGCISDGYHTFNELYDHRCTLFTALVNILGATDWFEGAIFKARYHSDGSSHEGWFLCCLVHFSGEQVSYHLPDRYWDLIQCDAYQNSPYEFDGHTSEDVLKSLQKWFLLRHTF